MGILKRGEGQGSRGAGEQGRRGAGEQGSRGEVAVSFSPLPLRTSASCAQCPMP
ncbi:MAG: hypothetical protein HWQ40_09795 [Nostoc sp. NMS9]|nr:hypothetical protein [Nostoc sp. NMS9]